LGDLGQQWCVWSRARPEDVVYAPCQTQTQVLAYLRALGLFRTPLVAVAHHPPVVGRLAWMRRWLFRWEARGTDRFPALSSEVARAVREISGRGVAGRGDYAPVLSWGPDLAYYAPFRAEAVGEGAAATGRTGRDWLAFGRGATRAGTEAGIFCLTKDVRPEFAEFGPNVRVHAHARESDLPYPRLLAELALARVIAIPISVGPALAGLTSAADALGLGKPLLATRHGLLDIDVEREGIGRWVAPGDPDDWARALRWFDENPAESAAMGRRARTLAETRWNSRLFAGQIAAILESASHRHAGGQPAAAPS